MIARALNGERSGAERARFSRGLGRSKAGDGGVRRGWREWCGAEGTASHLVVQYRSWSRSVVDWLYTKSLKSFEVVLHGFQHFRRVPLPMRDLAHDPQRLPGAE